MPRLRVAQPPLVGILCALVACELIFRRLLAPMIHIQWLAPSSPLRSLVDLAGAFSYHAATVLGCSLAALAVARVVMLPSVIPRGAKAAVGALAVAFVPLLILSSWRELPSVLAIYLQGAFTGLIVLFMFAGFLTRRRARAKLGLLILAAPIALYSIWTIGYHLHPDQPPAWARFALWTGEASSVAAAAVLLPCYFPRALGRRAALVVGPIIGLGGGVLLWKPDLAARVSAAFGLQFPSVAGGRILFAVAMAAWLLVVTALFEQGGAARLRAYGLALIGLAGYQHEAPYQIAATMVGFLCVVESLAREDAGVAGATAEVWRAMVKRIAALVGAREVVVVGAEGYETARVRVTRPGEPPAEIELALGRHGGAMSHAEVVIGYAPSEEAPPVALTRRGTPKLGRTKGDEVATGDVVFDETFRIFDSRHLTDRDRVLDDDLRPRLIAQLDGWLAVWPGAGVRYRTRNTRVLDDADPALPGLPALIDLLLDVKNRS